MYTIEELKKGEGLSSERPMKVFSYDGHTWDTCELSELVRGNPTHVYTVPPTSRGGWEKRA